MNRDDSGYVSVTGRVLGDAGVGQTAAGVPGVTVSDGLSVTQTDASGRYELTVDRRRRQSVLVFMTVLAGWQAPIGDFGAPDFWRAVDTSGRSRVADVDFVLHRDQPSRRNEYRFVTLADVHVDAGGLNPRNAFAKQLEDVKRLTEEGQGESGPPAFITVAGDLTNNATAGEFRDYLSASATSSIPIWPAVGNHDLVGRPSGGPYPTSIGNLPYHDLIEGYRQAIGPEWYSFQYGNQHYVVLENYRGLSERDQLVWLERDLAVHAAGKEIVIISHVPWNTPQTPVPAVASAFIDLLSAYDMKLIVAGHTHANDAAANVIAKAQQIVTTTSGAIPLDGAPRGFRTVEFYDGKIRYPFFELDADRKPTIIHPVGPVHSAPSTAVVSRYAPPNVPTEAEFRIRPQPWMPLERFGRRAWRAPIAGHNISGSHRLELRVRDQSGRAWAETAADFEVAEAVEAPTGTPRMGASWPMFHHDAEHSGRTTDVVAPPLRLAWTEHVGGTVLASSPAVTNGTIFLGVRDEDGSEANGVIALDLATGAQVWRSESGSQVEASVAVVDDLVLAPSARGPLRALDAGTGTTRWSWLPDHPGMPNCWMYFSPTVADGYVYQAFSVADGTWVVCLDVRTGRELWRTSQAVGRNWVSHASPAISDDLITFASAYANLVALDRQDGRLLWQTALGSGIGVHAKPVIAERRIHLACRGDQLVAVEPMNGDIRWKYRSPDRPLLSSAVTGATPAVADGAIYAAFSDGNITALSLDDGAPIWTRHAAGPVMSSPAISGDFLYVGSHDGQLRALDRHSGECLWSHDLGAWVASSPAVTGNAVVVASWDGTVYAFTSTET